MKLLLDRKVLKELNANIANAKFDVSNVVCFYMKIAFELFSFMQKATNLLEAVGKAERFFVMKASF